MNINSIKKLKKLKIENTISQFYNRQIRFSIISFLYLFFISYLTLFNNNVKNNDIKNIYIIIASILLIIYSYKTYKIKINEINSNNIVKWLLTVFIFSSCIWYAKHKINFLYGIMPDNIFYSSYAYGFFLAISISGILYGLSLLIYLSFKNVSFCQSLLSIFISYPLYSFFFPALQLNNSNINHVFYLLVLISLIYIFLSFIILKINKIYRINKKASIKNVITSAISILSICYALLMLGFFLLTIDPKVNKYFLYLDSYSQSECGKPSPNISYVNKNDHECIKITFNNFEEIRIDSIKK